MNIRTEYPRPQFCRESYLNLNGEWDFQIDNELSGNAKGFVNAEGLDSKIIVPFCPESRLSGVGNTDFMSCVWYKKKITLDSSWLNGHTILNIGACDYETTVYINGNEVTRHFGGYSPIAADITPYLTEGENDITIKAVDDIRNGIYPAGKQSKRYESYGCLYTRTTGIWQTVWLENVPQSYIKAVKMTPSFKNGSVVIEADIVGGDGMEFSAKAYFDGRWVASGEVTVIYRKAYITLNLSEIHPWDTKTPNLYDIEFTLGEDSVKSYFGLRDICFKDGKFYLNDKPIFQRLILDQGFYPDGIYTAPTEQDLIDDIKRSMAMGFNGARLHEKVFEPRFLYHCDKMGYLVWGEHGNWGMKHDGYECYEAFLGEWLEIVNRDYNHPAIIGWCPLNETPRTINPRFVKVLHDMTKALDSTRMFIDNSGWFHIDGCYDVYDTHTYCGDIEKLKNRFLPLTEGKKASCCLYWENGRGEYIESDEITFISEFGGIKYNLGEDSGWGYGEDVKEKEAFIEKIKGQIEALMFNSKISAFCYTQLTDVEQEQNGLYTYDRKPKVEPEIIKEILSQKAAMED